MRNPELQTLRTSAAESPHDAQLRVIWGILAASLGGVRDVPYGRGRNNYEYDSYYSRTIPYLNFT